MEYLQAEAPLDLSKHIERVNSNPNSTWVAGVNEKFEGASLKEIKGLMGTVVDPDWAILMPERNYPQLIASDDPPENFDARD